MAMKQVDQVRYDALESMITTLSGLGHDYETVYKAVTPQIKDFESATGRTVRIKSDFEIELIDRRRDFLRIRNPNDQAKTLRTKVDGVSIDVKIFKEGDFEFENATIAQSLRRLADEVGALPKELAEFPECEVGEFVASLEQKEGSEASEVTGTDSHVAPDEPAHEETFEFNEENADTDASSDTESHHEGSGFGFEGELDNPLGDDRSTEADELFGR